MLILEYRYYRLTQKLTDHHTIQTKQRNRFILLIVYIKKASEDGSFERRRTEIKNDTS